MKKLSVFILLSWLLCIGRPAAAQTTSASTSAASGEIIQEMQKTDPQMAQVFSAAIQRGDFEEAKKIYEEFKKKPASDQPPRIAAPAKTAPEKAAKPSLFEQILTQDLPADIAKDGLSQYGYALFQKQDSQFAPSAQLAVGPDYLIGPGDQFTLTLWGTTEGIFNLQVTKEGTITLPKVGVVAVAGTRFGELERVLKKHLSRYFANINASVAMGSLKTITVYLVGEVRDPGTITVSSLTTVYGALVAAGGPTKKGTLREIQVLRSGKVVKTLDLYDFLLRGDRSQDIRLQHEDTVFVPLIGPIAGVAGMVYRPAIYELKGKETISDVIKTAGGILPIALGGRLQLNRYRDNQKKAFLDMKLDDAKSERSDLFREQVQNMDTIVVRPIYDKVWETVELTGSVEHPGTYQWAPGIRLREIILQGQLLPTTDMKRAEVARITRDSVERTIIPINLAALMAGDDSQNIPLQPKDRIEIFNVAQNPANTWEIVHLTGAVRNQGNFQWKPDLRLREIILQGQLLPKADLKRADVARTTKDSVERTIIPINLAALMTGDESQNIPLEPKDRIEIFTVGQNPANAWEIVNLAGAVRNQGDFQWKPDLRLREIITQGQLLPTTDLTRADVVRLNKNLRDRNVIPVDLAALTAGDESQNIPLQPQDHVRVYSKLKPVQKVTVNGEVMRPGEYEISEEERLSDLLRRVGGFTAGAYPYGAVFKRSDVKKAEGKNLQNFVTRMQSQILQSAAGGTAGAINTEEAAFAKGEMALNQSLLQNLKAMQEQSEGRVAINITEQIDQWAGTRDDLLLKDGDSITVPKRPQEVMIMGEIHSPGAFVYLPGMNVQQYISQTGGYTNYAEEDQVFVLQANGSAISGDSPSVKDIEKLALRPGDTIFVPQKVDRYATMRFTKDIVDIMFKTAVVIATITILF